MQQPSEITDIAVIGAGAAGFFAAIQAAENHHGARVTIYEKTGKALGKVLISGGGRCNVTHQFNGLNNFLKNYPRGANHLRGPFTAFGQPETVAWFKQRGAELKTEADGRMFPVTDNSETIAGLLYDEAERLGVHIAYHSFVTEITRQTLTETAFQLSFFGGGQKLHSHVIVTAGGSPKAESYGYLAALGHTIVPPVPSLFTFNMPSEPLCELSGVSVAEAEVSLTALKQTQKGAVLITHWGVSGPAVLKLSAWAARELQEVAYESPVRLRWVASLTEDEIRKVLTDCRELHARKLVQNTPLFNLPRRLWEFLCTKAEMPEKVWSEAPKLAVNRLLNLLRNDMYQMQGKTTFKEEFVTCGGIELSEVDFNSMQSKLVPGLYFAGEVLNIDGVTGGFNFQAAWSTAAAAAKLLPL